MFIALVVVIIRFLEEISQVERVLLAQAYLRSCCIAYLFQSTGNTTLSTYVGTPHLADLVFQLQAVAPHVLALTALGVLIGLIARIVAVGSVHIVAGDGLLRSVGVLPAFTE